MAHIYDFKSIQQNTFLKNAFLQLAVSVFYNMNSVFWSHLSKHGDADSLSHAFFREPKLPFT